jgi:hypothetical protein
MGGYDIFMSVKQDDGNWAAPLNIGYPINSTDDDQFFVPMKDGEIAYFSRFTNDGFGRHDIYRYQIYSPDHPRLFNITGLLDFSGKAVDGPDVLITVLILQLETLFSKFIQIKKVNSLLNYRQAIIKWYLKVIGLFNILPI